MMVSTKAALDIFGANGQFTSEPDFADIVSEAVGGNRR
jgi:hypothetical protein